MQLIEQGEVREFLSILQNNGLIEEDFEIQEIDTTDPKGDEIYGLQGTVSVTRLSLSITKEYPIGYDIEWIEQFRRDLETGVFG